MYIINNSIESQLTNSDTQLPTFDHAMIF